MHKICDFGQTGLRKSQNFYFICCNLLTLDKYYYPMTRKLLDIRLDKNCIPFLTTNNSTFYQSTSMTSAIKDISICND